MISDLHIHTHFSDGLYSPAKVVYLAKNMGLKAIAITDHDNIYGIEQAIKASKDLDDFTVIPGIEFGCIHEDEEVHILGYFIDYHSPSIVNIIKKLQKSRLERGLQIIEKLDGIGINIVDGELRQDLSNHDYIGRPHIARALIRGGYVSSIQEAFNLYLDRGKPAYAERYRLELVDTIDLIHRVNGLAVLAHPGLLRWKTTIDHCIDMGIDGLEAIHPSHHRKDILYLIEQANKHGLFTTGGSDFHGDNDSKELLLGKYYINLNDICQMKERI
ncbi:MAG: PHP domain-containing protein [Tissierellia bacterium]|nr:PHP domain-containing protein [Tissierellia bacterium]